MLRSLGLRSDIVSMTGYSQVEVHPNGIVMRTPTEPTYWSGNVLIKTDGEIDADNDIAFFRAQFPQSAHVKILWDTPCPAPEDIRPHFSDDFEVAAFDVLTLQGFGKAMNVPDGITIRQLSHDIDWAASHALSTEVALEDDYDVAVHAPFLKRRYETQRAQVRAGLGAWFGAFDADLIVAHMGLFHDGTVARFQDVETRASHRRRGICAALLAYVSDWGKHQAPSAVQVIVAEADSDAGRLYRRHGFAQTERLVEVTSRGY